MNFNKKYLLTTLLVFIFVFSFTASAYEEEINVDRYDIRKSTDLPLDDKEILEMVEKNTPSINPKEFEERKSNEYTLASYGMSPPEKVGVESYDWNLLLVKTAKYVQNDPDFQKYRYGNGGPVFGYGSTYAGGYMTVDVDFERGKSLKQEDFDQIQKIFEKYANENGIKDLPLIITYENMGVPTVSNTDHVRPLIGSVNVDRLYGSIFFPVDDTLTIGYPVIKNNNSSNFIVLIAIRTFCLIAI